MVRKPTYKELEQRIRELGNETVRREQAEEALRVALTKYRTLFDAFPLGITVSDEAGKITETNLIAEKLLGVPQDGQTQRAIDSPAWRIVRPDGTPMLAEEYASLRALKGKRQVENVEMGIIKPDGEVTWISVTAAPLPLEGHGVVITYGDITERKLAEQKLRESERMLRTIVEHSNELFYVHDKEHILTYVSPQCKGILGYTPEEVAMKWTELTTENPVNLKGIAITEKAIESGKKQDPYFLELRRKDGTPVLLEIDESPIKDAEGKVLGITGAARDVTEHQRDEEALREAHDIISKSPAVAFLWENKEGWPVEFVSDNVEGLFGYKAEEFLSGYVPYSKTIHPDDFDRVAREVSSFSQDVGNERFVHDPYRVVTKYGEVKWIDDRTYIRRDETGRITHYQGIVEDITERKRTEEAIRERDKTLFQIIQGNSIPTFVINRQHIVTHWNKACEGLTGVSASEIIGTQRHWTAFYSVQRSTMADLVVDNAPDDEISAHYPRGYRGSVFTEGAYEAEDFFSLLGENGKWLFFTAAPLKDTEGNLTGAIETLQDITERKLAVEALRENAAKYRELVQNSNSIILRMDTQGNVTFFNEFAQRFFGYSEEEVLGRNVVGTIVPQADSAGQDLEAMIRDIGLRPERYETNENENMRQNGERIWVAWTNKGIRDADGNVIGILCIGVDITQRKRLEDQLRQAQKMEAIGTLAGGIAHDFNNILGAIIGYAELMELFDVPEESPMRSRLEGVLKAAYRAKDLVQQILTFSRQAKQERKPVQLGSIVKESLKFLRASLPSSIEIHQNIESQTGLVLADPTQIHQVLMNLCTNAAHAMREKEGVMEVELTEVFLNAQAIERYPELEPGDYIRLTVSDTGRGMSPEVMGRIYDPYFTTKEKGEGTGLGLAIVHGIVKNHRGAITVESALGKGTIFQVFLPALERETIDPRVKTSAALPTGRERILFVDDEKVLVDIGKGMLESFGFEVVTRTSSLEALEAFRTQPGRFDLIITDMTMPNMMGTELAKELLRIRSDIPIILCTGFSELVTPDKLKAMGIRGLIMKPISVRDLTETVRKVLDETG